MNTVHWIYTLIHWVYSVDGNNWTVFILCYWQWVVQVRPILSGQQCFWVDCWLYSKPSASTCNKLRKTNLQTTNAPAFILINQCMPPLQVSWWLPNQDSVQHCRGHCTDNCWLGHSDEQRTICWAIYVHTEFRHNNPCYSYLLCILPILAQQFILRRVLRQPVIYLPMNGSQSDYGTWVQSAVCTPHKYSCKYPPCS